MRGSCTVNLRLLAILPVEGNVQNDHIGIEEQNRRDDAKSLRKGNAQRDIGRDDQHFANAELPPGLLGSDGRRLERIAQLISDGGR